MEYKLMWAIYAYLILIGWVVCIVKLTKTNNLSTRIEL